MPFGREDTGYMQGWTAFYWAWWISWSPFVGMFIARVSRGRTVREFVTCVLIIPSSSAFCGWRCSVAQPIEQVMPIRLAAVKAQVIDSYNPPLSLFAMLKRLPLPA
jgi:BCCT family betaine/carnitine transporter